MTASHALTFLTGGGHDDLGIRGMHVLATCVTDGAPVRITLSTCRAVRWPSWFTTFTHDMAPPCYEMDLQGAMMAEKRLTGACSLPCIQSKSMTRLTVPLLGRQKKYQTYDDRCHHLGFQKKACAVKQRLKPLGAGDRLILLLPSLHPTICTPVQMLDRIVSWDSQSPNACQPTPFFV